MGRIWSFHGKAFLFKTWANLGNFTGLLRKQPTAVGMDNISFDWRQVHQGCTSSPKPLEMCTFSLWACKHRSCQCPSTFCGSLIHKPHKAFICFECWLQDRIRGKSRVKTLDFNFCLMANSCPAFTPEVKKKKRKEKGNRGNKNSKTVLLDF